MELSKPFHRKKIVVIFLACILIFSGLSARVVYLMVFRAAHYSELALDLHQRERKIKAKRGRILDRNGIVLADNQPVCTISVIHNQIRDPNAVIALLCSKLGLSERSEEHTSELQSHHMISYAVFCLKKKRVWTR